MAKGKQLRLQRRLRGIRRSYRNGHSRPDQGDAQRVAECRFDSQSDSYHGRDVRGATEG